MPWNVSKPCFRSTGGLTLLPETDEAVQMVESWMASVFCNAFWKNMACAYEKTEPIIRMCEAFAASTANVNVEELGVMQ